MTKTFQFCGRQFGWNEMLCTFLTHNTTFCHFLWDKNQAVLFHSRGQPRPYCKNNHFIYYWQVRLYMIHWTHFELNQHSKDLAYFIWLFNTYWNEWLGCNCLSFSIWLPSNWYNWIKCIKYIKSYLGLPHFFLMITKFLFRLISDHIIWYGNHGADVWIRGFINIGNCCNVPLNDRWSIFVPPQHQRKGYIGVVCELSHQLEGCQSHMNWSSRNKF